MHAEDEFEGGSSQDRLFVDSPVCFQKLFEQLLLFVTKQT